MELGTLYLRYQDFSYTFVIFHHRFSLKPEVDLNLAEHVEARWVTMEEALVLPLIFNEKGVLEFCQKKLQ